MTLENLFSLVEFIQATERSRRRPDCPFLGDTLTLESYAFVVESAQANKVSRGGSPPVE